MNPKCAVSTVVALTVIGAAYSGLRAQPPAAPSVWDGVYTEEQAQRGKPVYIEHCSFCHGETLEGDDESTPLVGDEFRSNWDGLPLGRLYDRIRKDMPLSHPGTLNRKQNADILAYILSVNEFPSSQVELPPLTDLLNLILFQASRPDPKR